jgi:hypothetical protein
VTSIASLLVALIALTAALVSAQRSATATHAAAERSARSLLEAESAKSAIDDRRHLRSLVADVAAAAAERSDLSFRRAVTWSQDPDLWTAENQEQSEQAFKSLERSMSLVMLTTKNAQLREALDGISTAQKGIRDAFERASLRSPLGAEQLESITDACDGLEGAAAGLIKCAAELLAME